MNVTEVGLVCNNGLAFSYGPNLIGEPIHCELRKGVLCWTRFENRKAYETLLEFLIAMPLKIKKLSPKAKLALKMVMLAGATNKEAAKAVGLHPAYLPQLKSSEPGKALMGEMEAQLDEKALETTVLMDRLGREALHRLATLMRHCESPNIQLRAAMDLADRAPATSKVHKHQVESFTLGSHDAKEIAAALVESAAERSRFIGASEGEFIKVESPDDGHREVA